MIDCGVDALGARVFLRRLTPEELDDRVIDWFRNPEAIKYYSRDPSRFGKESLMRDLEEGWTNGTLYTYGAYVVEGEALFGILRLGPIDLIHRTSDMPLIVGDRSIIGKGDAVEAIRLGTRLAFDKYDIRKLHGGMYEANVAAIKAYSRAGWVSEGRLIGHYLVDGESMDRILFACFNPRYFPDLYLEPRRELNES